MYPQAETSDGRLDSLDSDNFKYEMTAREMPSRRADRRGRPDSRNV
jgi:hypothetical protein